VRLALHRCVWRSCAATAEPSLSLRYSPGSRAKGRFLTEHDILTRLAHALAAGLVVLCANACSSAPLSGSGSSSTNGPSAAEFPGLAATEVCGALQACCAAAKFPYDAAVCQSQISGEFEEQISGVGNENGYAFDSAAAQRCLDELAQAIQGCSAFDKLTTQDCDRLLVGVLPVGSPCTDSRACAGRPDVAANCMLDANGLNGTCVLEPSAPRGKLGDSCTASCDELGDCTSEASSPSTNVACYQSDGLYCSPTLQCAPISGAGGPCSADTTSGCSNGLECLDSSGFPASPYAAGPDHCGNQSPNGLLATPYSCLGEPNPNQN
jgi:hypothetical protein